MLPGSQREEPRRFKADRDWAEVDAVAGWARLIGEPVSAAVAATILTLVGKSILFRLLPLATAGRFALLLAVYQMVALLANLGQPTQIMRLYSRRQPGTYDWLRDLLGTAAFTFAAVLIGSLLAGRLYGLRSVETLFAFAAGMLQIMLLSITRMLSSQRHYTWSSLLLRLPNSLMVLPAVAILFAPSFGRLESVLISQLLFLMIALVLGVGLLARHLERGSTRVSLRVRLQGIVFVVYRSNVIISDEGMLVIAGVFISSADVAALAALMLLTRPFDLLRSVIFPISLTELSRRDGVQYGRLISGMWKLSVVLAGGALLVTPVVAHWIYAARYDTFLYLIPWLVLVASLRLTEALARGHIFGPAPSAIMNRFMMANVAIAIIGIGLGIRLTIDIGVLGIVLTGAISLMARNVVGYILVWLSRDSRLE